MKRYFATVVLMLLAGPGIFAKRVHPPKVTPITKDGITYTATGDGKTACVVASDANTGKELWKAKIYHVHINPFIEEDNQWIYISEMNLSGNAILIRNEAARCYRLNLIKKSVKKDKCDE